MDEDQNIERAQTLLDLLKSSGYWFPGDVRESLIELFTDSRHLVDNLHLVSGEKGAAFDIDDVVRRSDDIWKGEVEEELNRKAELEEEE